MLGESWQVVATAGSIARRRTSDEVSARVASPVAESLEPTIIDRGQEIDGGVLEEVKQQRVCIMEESHTCREGIVSGGGRAVVAGQQHAGVPRSIKASDDHANRAQSFVWVPTIDLSCRSGDHGGYDH